MELMVVVSIISILVVAFGASFFSWREQYKAESDIKSVHAAMLDAKVSAMNNNLYYFIHIPQSPGKVVRIYRDSDPAPKGDGSLDTAADTLEDTIELNNYIEILDDYRTFTFNTQGLLLHPNSHDPNKRDFHIRMVVYDEDLGYSTSTQADNNCLRVSPPLYWASGMWNATAEQEGSATYRDMALKLSGDKYVTGAFPYPLCTVK
jgi:hypothetical protein